MDTNLSPVFFGPPSWKEQPGSKKYDPLYNQNSAFDHTSTANQRGVFTSRLYFANFTLFSNAIPIRNCSSCFFGNDAYVYQILGAFCRDVTIYLTPQCRGFSRDIKSNLNVKSPAKWRPRSGRGKMTGA